MKILISHNSYSHLGGEDAVAEAEAALLRDHGHEVVIYSRSNSEIATLGLVEKIDFYRSLSFSKKTYNEITSLMREFNPDIAHFHNIFFMITPSAYYACKDMEVPVVQSLHNFRLFCMNALLLRDGKICEKCLNGTKLNGVYHSCYKGIWGSLAMYRLLKKCWKNDVWTKMVDIYITATEFTKKKYEEAGLPSKKIMVKPNFLYPEPSPSRDVKEYALYIGRLSDEKGVDFLIESWKHIKDVPLKIIGEGPRKESLNDYVRANNINNVEFLGHVSRSECEGYFNGAKLMVIPSKCYENFPMVVAEAFAFGIPVIASNRGSLKEIVKDGENGYLFSHNDMNDFIAKIRKLVSSPDIAVKISRDNCREYEEKYNPEKNYQKLINIYSSFLDH